MNRLLATTLALVLGGSGVSLASNSSLLQGLDGRIQSLEAQVRDQAVPLPPVAIGQETGRIVVAQSAASLAVRVDRLEEQMRQYNGQIEELNFRVRQLQEQLQRFQEDSEFRFQDLERKTGTKRSSINPPAEKPAAQQFEQLGTPPQSLGSLSQNQLSLEGGTKNNSSPGGSLSQPGAGPIDLSSMLSGNVGAPVGGNDGSYIMTGDPATDYDTAYGFILNGNYHEAESAFQQFVNAYGGDRLAPNAYYWLGESKFQQGQYRDAIQVFLDAYSQFPNVQKSPEMLMRTGMALRQINEKDAACATFEELLQKFPNVSPAIRQKVQAEIKSGQC
ncbi:tol-pal system protein YbgF [uncultured Cohaesibacter sp.]|uniref:tol-pal system protein YbgF n=1 Tax=uncultured Cohaesibacter sp. TaxID=1002546 RepID=UPI00292D071A|nr:tol-pal system protein YbgF [uncultured Cohaesibacter sp.]